MMASGGPSREERLQAFRASGRDPFADRLPAEVVERTLCQLFLETATQRRDLEALRWRTGDRTWESMTWADYRDAVAQVAGALAACGLKAGDLAVLLTPTRAEWFVLDMACAFLGVWPITLYQSSTPDQLAYVINQSGAALAVASGKVELDRLQELSPRTPSVRTYVSLDETAQGHTGVLGYADLLGGSPLDLDAAASRITPDDVATVIYTSGSTGDPKGVLVTHRAAAASVSSYALRTGLDIGASRVLSAMPMAHSGERTAHWLQLVYGTVISICSNFGEMFDDIAEVRPNWLWGAPRFWEKQRLSVLEIVDAEPGARARFDAARELGQQVFRLENSGREVPAEVAERWAQARDTAVTPYLARLGMDDAIVAITGSAPMSGELQEWWIGIGIRVADTFGSTETMMISWDPHRITSGTSGKPLPGVRVRVAEDGELLVKSHGLFIGYLDNPEATAEAFDDGWYRTGDLGRLDEDGNVQVIGRKKDMIVPSSGHNVSPVNLEAALKELLLIGQACVVGDGRPYCVALIVPDPEQARHLVEEQDGRTVEQVVAAHIDEVNTRFPKAEQIGGYAILDESWDPGTEVMTPTGKLRRAGVKSRYEDLIERIYTEPRRATS